MIGSHVPFWVPGYRLSALGPEYGGEDCLPRTLSRNIGAVGAFDIVRDFEISLGGLGVENPQRGSGRSPEALGLRLRLGLNPALALGRGTIEP